MGKRFKRRGSFTGGNPPLPVVPYQYYRETAPLLPKTRARTRIPAAVLVQLGCWCLVLVALSFTAYQTSMHFIRCPLDPSSRDSIRLEWEKEAMHHTVLELEWKHKVQEKSKIERGWERETHQHEQDVARRTHEEQVRQARVREEREREQKQWKYEMERHAHEVEEVRRREMEERERERQRWRREVEEREHREEEERQRHHMYWGHIEAHTCTTYATREYSAQLMNLPASWEHRVEACKNTPLEVHGISHVPKSCEDRGPGVVIGRWEISQQEPDCTTYWDDYNDKGCTSPGSGKRHYTQKLMNLPEGSNWREFCATTPISFNHMRFPGAEECFTAVWGVYGRWEMDDSQC